MIRPAFPLEAEQREAIVDRIARHLHRLDDRALLRLVDRLQEPGDSPETVADTLEQVISRRSFVATLLGGGVLAATTSALAVWQWGLMHRQDLTNEVQTLKGHLKATSEDLNRRLEASSEELERVWGLVELYRQLEALPMERAALDGVTIVGATLAVVLAAARSVRDGVRDVEALSQRLDASQAKILANLAWLEGILASLSERLHVLEEALSHALSEASSVAQALSTFFDQVLALLPGSLGQRAREILDHVGELVSGLPGLIEGISLNIVALLREEWFSDQADKGLKGWFIAPLVARVIDPIELLLDELTGLEAQWKQSLDEPLKRLSQQRAGLRQQIADYEARHKLRK
jgi:phage shock protein A